MEKINFINQSTPALNATNLNKLQDNVENAIQDTEDTLQDNIDSLNTNKLEKTSVKTATTTSNTDTYCCNYINDCLREELIYNQKIYPTISININTSKYKRLVICFAMFDSSSEGSTNTGGGNNATILDLSNTSNIGYYKTNIFTPYINSGSPQTTNFVSEFTVNSTKTSFSFYCWRGNTMQTQSATQYYVSKIYGQW